MENENMLHDPNSKAEQEDKKDKSISFKEYFKEWREKSSLSIFSNILKTNSILKRSIWIMLIIFSTIYCFYCKKLNNCYKIKKVC